MHIEVGYIGRVTTCSELKWIAVGVALHVALHALVFCEDEADVEVTFDGLHC